MSAEKVIERLSVRLIKIASWTQFQWLRHGFSTRAGGVSTVYGPGELNLGHTREDSPETVVHNRKLLLQDVGGEALATLHQVHGAILYSVDQPGVAGQGDGLLTASPGLMLGILTADCTPVLVADTATRAVAAFHAGWRGTAARIVQHGIARMRHEFGSRPQDLIAAVGPAIGRCCYCVGDELHERFTAEFPYTPSLFTRGQDGWYLDLAEANRRQLLDSGVTQVSAVAECTACTHIGPQRKYFSHRAEQGRTGRMMNLIGTG